MDSTVAIILALTGLALGALIGWLLGSRTAVAGREIAQSLRHQLDAVREERDIHRGEADGLRLAFGESGQELAALKATNHAREAAFNEQIAALLAARETMSAQFSEIGGKLLGEAQKVFLERADARFHQAGERHEEKLKTLLQPVETTLKRYEEGLAKVEKERVGSYESLRETITLLAQGNDQVRRETQRLANVMVSSPKARGRWGEQQLRTILESAGLAENVDFELQTSVADGERMLRPDCVIRLPGGRCIVIDVKCPLVAFEQAFEEEDEAKRSAFLAQHAAAMKAYAGDLGRKGYWRQFELSPDFVIMFIPGEHFLAAAAERAPELIENAFRNGVIIASTINMLALAKIMAGMWRQEELAARAHEVAEVGKELYRRLSVMGGHVAKLGRNLGLAAGAYNDFVGSLESQVLTQARRFETLKVDTGGKSIEAVPVIEVSPRPLTKLTTTPAEDETEATARG